MIKRYRNLHIFGPMIIPGDPYQLEAEEMEAKAEFVETELNPLAGAPGAGCGFRYGDDFISIEVTVAIEFTGLSMDM